jgi:cell division protease FtsH
MRAGRFDRQVLVDKPDVKGREAILRIHVRAVKLSDDVNLAIIAARTAGFAAPICQPGQRGRAAGRPAGQGQGGPSDFDEAIDRVIAGLEKKRAMNPRVGASSRTTRPDTRSSRPCCRPRSGAQGVDRVAWLGALGYTMQLPTEDRYLITKTELEHSWPCCWRARAELLVFGRSPPGAERSAARHGHRACDGDGVRDERQRRAGEPRGPAPQPPFIDAARRMPERGAYGEDTAALIDGRSEAFCRDARIGRKAAARGAARVARRVGGTSAGKGSRPRARSSE